MGSLGAPKGAPGGKAQLPVYFDYMSYCHYPPSEGGFGSDGDDDRWTSVIGQNENVDLLHDIAADHGRTFALGTSAMEAVLDGVPILRVQGIADTDGSVKITRIKPKGGPPERSPATSAFQLVLRDARGQVLSETPMRAAQDADSTSTFLSGEASSAGAVRAEIRRGGTIVAARGRSASAPRVRVLGPGAGARVGGGPIVVAWSATDADGDTLRIKVDYSLDAGRRWRALHSGPDTGRLVLPRSVVPASNRARFRVRANDGFNEGAALSGLVRSLGATPAVRILSPANGEHVRADGRLDLRGTAEDDRRRRIPGTRLTWYDGPRRLGAGGSLGVLAPRPGLHRIRLVARDDRGRVGVRQVRIRVLATAPQFLRVEAPPRVGHRARRIPVRVSSTIPATLVVGRQSFAVGRVLRLVAVAVRPGRKPLTLPLRLKANGGQARAALLVRR
jgi:hypothetical protein